MKNITFNSSITIFLALILPLAFGMPGCGTDSNRRSAQEAYFLAENYGPNKTLATLKAAITAIGPQPATLLLSPGVWTIDSDLSIPPTITLKLKQGALLTIADRVTLTIEGPFKSGSWQCFDWTESGRVMFGPGSVKQVNPTWLGAQGNGITDDTKALAKTAEICSISKLSLYIPEVSNYYKLTDTVTVKTSVSGQGFYSAIKQTSPEKNVFNIQSDNITISNIRIMGANIRQTGSTILNNGIFIKNCKNININNCQFHEFDFAGIRLENVTDYLIKNNIFFNNNWTNNNGTSDIIAYSNIFGGRAIISNNLCLSNNSQGIYINALGKDNDIIISENICITLDNNFKEVNVDRLKRRHGIICSYMGSENSARKIIITSNIVSNTRYCGIYGNASPYPSGPFIITNNHISNVALQPESQRFLQGGIIIFNTLPGSIIENNIIDKVLFGVGITFKSNIETYDQQLTISNNTISNCGIKIENAAYGMYGEGYINKIIIACNRFYNNVNTDLRLTASAAGETSSGSMIITGNIFHRKQPGKSIDLFMPKSKNTNLIYNNIFEGNGNNNQENRAMTFFGNNISFNHNLISNHYHGISFTSSISGQTSDIIINWNNFNKVNTGIFGVSNKNTNAATVPLIGNSFQDVITPYNDTGAYAFYLGLKVKNNVIVYHSSEPTRGSWIKGDLVLNSSPEKSASFGWICVTSGTFGTDKHPVFKTLAHLPE